MSIDRLSKSQDVKLQFGKDEERPKSEGKLDVGGRQVEVTQEPTPPIVSSLHDSKIEPPEEVGQRANRVEALGWIWTTPGFADEKIHLYAGFELEPVDKRPEDDEIIEPVRVALDDALAMVWSGELTDAKSALALIHAARHVGRIR